MALTKITPQMFDTSAAGHDFNIDNGTFVVDASANRVGIGTASPGTPLHITGITTFDGDGASRAEITSSTANSVVSLDVGGFNGTPSVARDIRFLTNAAANAKTERMRISSAGHFIPAADSTYNIGANATRFANAYFDTVYGTLATAAQTNITSVGTLTGLTITGNVTVNASGGRQYINTGHLRLSDTYNLEWGGGTNYIRGSNASNELKLVTNSTAALTLDSSQNATFAGTVASTGLTTSGTINVDTIQNASGNLNILSTQNILLRFDSDNNQTNRELNIQNNASDQILKITETGTVTFSGNMLISDGSVSAPAIGFANDTDTGILRVTTNALGITAGGSRKFYVNATNAYYQNLTQVQIDSGNFYVDGHTGLRMAADSNIALKVLQSSSLTHGGYFQINGGTATGLEINATAGSISGTALLVQQSSVTSGGYLARFANSSGNKVTIETDGTTNFAGNVKASDIIAAGSGGLALQTDEGTKRLFVKDNGDVKVGALAVPSATSAPLHVAKANTDVQAIFGDNNSSIDDPSIRIIGRNSANSTARYTFVGLDADANHGFIGYNAGAGVFKNGLIFKTDGVVINELDGKKFFTLTDEFTASANSTTNFKINVSDYTGASAGGYCFYTVSVMGYASGGANGLTFTYTSGGYSGHNYSATNYNSYGSGTIQNGASGSTQYTNVGLSYHPAVNLGGYIASGSVWVYVPAAQQYGVTVVNTAGTGMACFLTIEGWST